MNEKSLIYSLFSKFLDEGRMRYPGRGRQSPEREQDKNHGPRGSPMTERTRLNMRTETMTTGWKQWRTGMKPNRGGASRWSASFWGRSIRRSATQESESYDEDRPGSGDGGDYEGSSAQKDGIKKEEVTQDAWVEGSGIG